MGGGSAQRSESEGFAAEAAAAAAVGLALELESVAVGVAVAVVTAVGFERDLVGIAAGGAAGYWRTVAVVVEVALTVGNLVAAVVLDMDLACAPE